jgi:hypothetical protein
MRHVVLILRRAREDVAKIDSWLADHSPAGADRWFEAWLTASTTLDDSPLSYPLAPESDALGLSVRERHFGTPKGKKYRLLFVIVGHEVRILSVRGPGQSPVTWDDLL